MPPTAKEEERAAMLLMSQEDLDEMVHEAKAGEAADINNSGKEEQVKYLLDN